MKGKASGWAFSVNHGQNSAVIRNMLCSVSECRMGPGAGLCKFLIRSLTVLVAACALALCQVAPLHAQQRKNKVPIVGKFGSGKRRQAYSGKVQSLDMKQRVLNVNSLHGQESEIFPFKKNVRVENLNGKRMDLAALTPGSTVLIYFDQKSGERTIRNIVVLTSGKKQAKGKPAPSS